MGSGPDTGTARTLGTLQLAVIIFFCVCGGPFGLEEAVHHGGAGWTLCAILGMPLIWSLPVALLTCELGTAIPQSGGYIVWVDRAFGPFWGFFEGYTAWISDVFDNALYPILFTTYLEALVSGGDLDAGGHVFSNKATYAVRYGCLALVTFFNIGGLQAVGYMSIFFAVCTLAPFLVLCCMAAPGADTEALTTFRPAQEVHWGIVLSTVMWSIDGWDAPASVAGQVRNPNKTYPRAVLMVMIVAVCAIFFPVAAGISVEPDTKEWGSDRGTWAKVAWEVGGVPLQWAVVGAGMIANLGMFNVLLATSVWSLYALCLPGLMDVPAITHLHPQFRTPVASVLVNAAAIAVVLMFDFTFLVQIDVTLNCFNLLLGDFALLWLRVKEPDLPRPYKIPFGTIGTAVFYLPHITLCSYMAFAIDYEARLIVVAVCGLGLLLWPLGRALSNRRRAAHVPPLAHEEPDIATVFQDVPGTLAEEHDEHGVTLDELPMFGVNAEHILDSLPDQLIPGTGERLRTLSLVDNTYLLPRKSMPVYGATDLDAGWTRSRSRSEDFWGSVEAAKRGRVQRSEAPAASAPAAAVVRSSAPQPAGLPAWAKPPS